MAPRGSSITYKCTALEMQNHKQLSPNAKKNHGMFPKKLTPCIDVNLTTTTPVYIALHVNAVMSSTSEAVSVYPDIRRNNIFSLLAFAWLCGSPYNKALKTQCRPVELLQVGGKDFTVNPVQDTQPKGLACSSAEF